ncbi:MAG: hypothetical protein OEV44_01180 [Spirochaetota bacterium]|nr:hypothetical protein [Spirochaetota bacterium]
MTQKDKLLQLLQKGSWVTVQQMQTIAWRYGARLHDLRVEGYEFEKRKQKNSRLEEWRLIK